MDLLDHVWDLPKWAGCALIVLCLALAFTAGFGVVAMAVATGFRTAYCKASKQHAAHMATLQKEVRALRQEKKQLKADLVKAVAAHRQASQRTEAAEQALGSANIKLTITTQDAEYLRLHNDVLQKSAQKQAEEMGFVALANIILQDKLKAANHTNSLLQDKLTAANHTTTVLQDELTAATSTNRRLLVRVGAATAFIERAKARLLTVERVQSDAAQLSAKVQKLEAEALTLAQAHTAAAEEARKEKALRAQMEEAAQAMEPAVAAAVAAKGAAELQLLKLRLQHMRQLGELRQEADERLRKCEEGFRNTWIPHLLAQKDQEVKRAVQHADAIIAMAKPWAAFVGRALRWAAHRQVVVFEYATTVTVEEVGASSVIADPTQ